MKKEEFPMTDEELDRDIEDFLAVYTVPKVDDEKIDETIEVLRAYMPAKKKEYSVRTLMKNEITYIDKYYFILSIISMFAGIILRKGLNVSLYESMLYISPLPLLIGVYTVIRGRSEKMWELEKSFKYSYSKVILARILIVMISAAVLDSIVCVYLQYGEGFDTMVRLMCSWIIPMCTLCSSNLLIMKKTSGFTSMAVTSVLWFMTVLLLGSDIAKLLAVSRVNILAILSAASFILTVICIKNFCSSAGRYEGEFQWS